MLHNDGPDRSDITLGSRGPKIHWKSSPIGMSRVHLRVRVYSLVYGSRRPIYSVLRNERSIVNKKLPHKATV